VSILISKESRFRFIGSFYQFELEVELESREESFSDSQFLISQNRQKDSQFTIPDFKELTQL